MKLYASWAFIPILYAYQVCIFSIESNVLVHVFQIYAFLAMHGLFIYLLFYFLLKADRWEMQGISEGKCYQAQQGPNGHFCIEVQSKLIYFPLLHLIASCPIPFLTKFLAAQTQIENCHLPPLLVWGKHFHWLLGMIKKHGSGHWYCGGKGGK